MSNELNNSELNKVSVTGLMFYFITLTIFYTIICAILIQTSTNTDSANIILTIIYSGLIILGSYYINVQTLKNLCGKDDQGYVDEDYEPPLYNIIVITFLPWLVVFGSIFFLLELFPSWVRPFSNTIGYLFISFLGADKIIKDAVKNGNTDENENSNLITAIRFLNKNTTMFINELSNDEREFNKEIEELKKSKIINELHDDNKAELFKLINIKHMIGKGMWYILSGTIISSISYNILLDMDCTKSLSQMSSDISGIISSNSYATGYRWKIHDKDDFEIWESYAYNKEDITQKLRDTDPDFLSKFSDGAQENNSIGIPFGAGGVGNIKTSRILNIEKRDLPEIISNISFKEGDYFSVFSARDASHNNEPYFGANEEIYYTIEV
jgi:hypothetical protein